MRHLVFDIESIAQDEARLLALAPEFTAPANLKDPEKIAAAIAMKRASILGMHADEASDGSSPVQAFAPKPAPALCRRRN